MTPGTGQQPGNGAIQEGGAASRRHAADHAGQPHHHDGRDPQGLRRVSSFPSGRRIRCRRSTPRTSSTQIAVNNGDTAVIGGIYEETINNDVTKVPFLGDIPILGYLFKTTNKNIDKDRAADLPDAANRQGIGHAAVRVA